MANTCWFRMEENQALKAAFSFLCLVLSKMFQACFIHIILNPRPSLMKIYDFHFESLLNDGSTENHKAVVLELCEHDPLGQVGGHPLTLTGLFALVTAGGCLIGRRGVSHFFNDLCIFLQKADRNLGQFKISRWLWLMMMMMMMMMMMTMTMVDMTSSVAPPMALAFFPQCLPSGCLLSCLRHSARKAQR